MMRTFGSVLSKLAISRSEVVLLLAVAVAFALISGRAVRVGDGSEYYALFLAWKETLAPFMTERSWSAYALLMESGAIMDAVPENVLRESFPALRLGATADFNHFWFYSAIAVVVNAVAWVLRIPLSPHGAFMTAHWVLFALPLIVARRHFGWAGVAVMIGLTLLSPIVWYANKVHTEFFTYCLVLTATMLFLRRRYVASAFFLAATSTQNPSFAAVALVPIIVDFVTRRGRQYSTGESLLLAFTAVVLLLHPTYYFFRYGIVTPQLLSGGAKIGAAWSSWYVWLLDPDVGLLPNWPLGVVLIAIAAIAVLRGHRIVQDVPGWWTFVAVYLLIGLAAQSSTENLNSGATPGIARYALWYLPLFFPLGLTMVEWTRAALLRKVGVGALLVACAVYNLALNRPHLPESYDVPSPLSFVVQKYVPWIYDPHAEIFAERYSGVGELVWRQNVLAVVGPDCRKVLLIHNPDADRVFAEPGCGFDSGRVATVLKPRLPNALMQQRSSFTRLTTEDAARSMLACEGRIDLANSGNFATLHVFGLGVAENHGRWNDGAVALFSCVLPQDGRETTRDARVIAHGFVPAGRLQRLRIAVNGVYLPEVEFVAPGEKSIDLKLPEEAAVVTLRFEFPDRVSPHELGLSSDARKLAVGIRAIEFR